MNYSFYNIYLSNHPISGYTTIVNLLSKRYSCYKTNNLFPKPKQELICSLFDKGFIINNLEDERQKAIDHYYEKAQDTSKLTITFILTGSCNCDCVYCYEKGYNIHSVYKFTNQARTRLDRYIINNNVKRLTVIFFGGEPLLQKETITEISEYLYNKYSYMLSSYIITNGTLIDTTSIKRWNQNGLKGIKVTIDGTKQYHDSRRKYKDGSGTYDDIIKNLSGIKDLVEIHINTVIGKDSNIDDYRNMIKEIKRKGINAKYSINLVEPCLDMNQTEQAMMLLKYIHLLREEKCFQYMNISNSHGEVCQAKSAGDIVVDGNGNIYPCNAILNRIETKINVNSRDYHKELYIIKPECFDCRYLPICNGDCPYAFNCKKEYFDALLPEAFRVYISLRKEVTT